MRVIRGAHIVLKDSIIYNGALAVGDDGTILDYGRSADIPSPAGAQEIDGRGRYLGPGLVDIHTHAGGPHWFYDEPVQAAQHHLAHGTTSLLPALYFDLNAKQLVDAAALLRKAAGEDDSNIRGIYLEGPYLNPKFGAAADNNQWAGAIDRAAYLPVLQAVAGFTRVVCLAPEREGIEAFVDDACALMPGVRLAVAHSEASPGQIEALIPRGLCIGTHHTNATGDLPKYPECRGVCVDETVNYNDAIYAELICDERGIHVDPYMLRLVRKIKGDGKIILISDACVYNGPVPPGYEGVTDINFDDVGQIAGSKLTLERAALNMMRHTGAGLCDAFRFAATNPARAVGLADRGEIRRGAVADLILTDDLFGIHGVFLAGRPVA